MRASMAALAIAAAAIVALAGAAAEAHAQAAVTYTARITTTTTTVLTFSGPLALGDGTAVTTSTTIDTGDWTLHNNVVLDPANPARINGLMVTTMSVTRTDPTPQITITHPALARQGPNLVVTHAPQAAGAATGLAGVTTSPVVATADLLTFTAEVRDNAQVVVTFSGAVTANPAKTTPVPQEFTHPQELNPVFVEYTSRSRSPTTATAFATAVTDSLASMTTTLTFDAGELLTSTPLITYTYEGGEPAAYTGMLNQTYAFATDNASPVAFASFSDGDTITVEFSEEMAMPTQSEIGGVTVADGDGTAVAVSAARYTPHVAATASDPFTRPTLELDLAAPAQTGAHTVSFPGFEAAGGPADKRAVGAATATISDLTYTAASTSTTTTVLTFADELQSAGAAVMDEAMLDNTEWKVYDITRRGSAAPATLSGEVAVSAAAKSTVSGSPVITLTHAAIKKSPYPIVEYEPAETPALTGPSSAALSTAPVVASPSLPAFTAEVRDGAEVRLTFEAAVTDTNNGPTKPSVTVTPESPDSLDVPGRYVMFAHDRILREREMTPSFSTAHRTDGYDEGHQLFPTGWTNNAADASRQITLNFPGDRAADLLTSTPHIVYVNNGSPAFTTTAGDIINGTSAVATDNASPVAYASFADTQTIRVEFSEEMAEPAQSELDGVTVTAGGQPVEISARRYAPHADATATAAFTRPSLELGLAAAAAAGTYTVSFPGFEAAGGPADKRSVANAMATVDSTTPLRYTAAAASATTTVLTFPDTLSMGGTAVAAGAALTPGEWRVYDVERVGRALPAALGGEETPSAVAVTTAGATPTVTLTHGSTDDSPYPIVRYMPGATPELTVGSSPVSAQPVVASPWLPAFTAEVRDGAEVLVTFEGPVMEPADAGPRECSDGGPLLPTPYVAFMQPRTARVTVFDYACADSGSENYTYPTEWSPDLGNRRVALSFAGEASEGLLTSTPTIVYGHRGTPLYRADAADELSRIINGTAAVATDNASPVAFASFADADTITVRFSEEMAEPSATVLGDVAVSGPSGAAVAVSGTPVFTAHTPATETAPFGRPTLEIELAAAASAGTHTVSFPGFAAAGGPADKRAVAAARAPFMDTAAPTFTAEVRDGGQVVLTFSEVVRREGIRVIDDGDIYHHTYDGGTVTHSEGNARDSQAGVAVHPTSVSFAQPSTTMTLTFAGEAQRGLLTSMPRVGYAYAGPPIIEDESDNALVNMTTVTATDNASPVAFASFSDADTITVRFSEEMATPSSTVLDNVAVTSAGATVAISGTPTFTAHTAATSTSAFVFPTLGIDLASPAALNAEHTVSFPGFVASGGPTAKRAVADATATLTDTTAPDFVVHNVTKTRLIVTFDEEVRTVAGTTPNLDDWEIDPMSGGTSDTAVNPTDVTQGHNFVDLTIAAVGGEDIPTVRYVESTSTIEDLFGNALPVTETAKVTDLSPIPLSAVHSAASGGGSQVVVTFSEPVIGSTTASDWAVEGAAVTTVAPSGTIASASATTTVTLSGFTLPADATPDVTYSGTALTENEATSPETADAREVRAADMVAPTITAAETTSGTQILVTMSENVEFDTAGTAATAMAATGHWMTVLNSVDTPVTSVAISGRIITLTVAGANAWQLAETPDVKYTRDVTGADAGEIVDAADNALADVTFTETSNNASFEMLSAATADELTDIMDQRDPADNVHAEYVIVTLSADARLASGTAAARAAHWTVNDDDADTPADVPVEDVALVEGAANQIRLTLGASLSSTAATPAVSYSAVTSAGRVEAASDGEALPDFGPVQATDGIPPRLVAYPEGVPLPDYKDSVFTTASTLVPAMGAAAECTESNVPAGCPELNEQWLTTISGEKGIAFTFSEPIDPASVGGSAEIANIAMNLQVASGEALRGLTGQREVTLNNGNTGVTWLPRTFDLLRAEDSGGAHTTFTTGAIIPDRTNSGGDRDDDNPRAPASSPALGAGGNVVTYVVGTTSGTIESTTTTEAPAGTFTTRLEYPPTNEDGEVSRPRQNIWGFFYNQAGAPRDAAGNAYRANVHVDSVHGTPADAADPAAYDSSTRGIHGTFIVPTDIEAPHFRATAVSPTTVQAVYMEPVRFVDGAAQMAASHWRLDTTPNDDTDNTDGATWITPTGIETTFGAFERPEYLAFGAPDHTTPTDSRLTVTLTGFTDLDPQLKSGSTDTRPYLYYVAPPQASGADPPPTSAVEDLYGNRAPQDARARLVDTAPPEATAAFTDEHTVRVEFSEPRLFVPSQTSFPVTLHDSEGTTVATELVHDNGNPAVDPVVPPTVTLTLGSSLVGIVDVPAGPGAHEVRISGLGMSRLTDDPGSPSGALSPRAWSDPDTIGMAASQALPGNPADLPITLALPALPDPPAFTAATASLNTVTVTFTPGALSRMGTGNLAATSWAVELVPAGTTPTERTAATTDDIAVTGVATIDGDITGVTLTLDADDDNIGDTSKRVFVTYTKATPSEFTTSPPTGTIARSLQAGTGALAADGVPPTVTAEVTGAMEITLTFDEALGADPTRAGVTYEITAPDGTITPDDTDSDPDVIELSTATGPAYTAATASSQATVTLTTANALTSVDHTVTITSSATVPVADVNGAAIPTSHEVTAAAPAAPTFTAATSSNTEILLAFDQPVMFASEPPSLSVDNWIVDPNGSDGATNMDTDDITVSSATLAGRTVTLTLDASDAQIGDTSKTPYVEYTAASGSEEIVNVLSAPMTAGTSATAADGAPPVATAAFAIDEQRIQLTFSEALASNPVMAMSGNTFSVHAPDGTEITLAGNPSWAASSRLLTFILSTVPGLGDHEIRFGGTGTIADGATPANEFDKSTPVAVPAAPAPPGFDAATASLDTVTLTFTDAAGTTQTPLARFGSSPPALAASNWAAELVPAGTTPTERTAATDDDIAVTGVTAAAADSNMLIPSVTLTLDADSANIGDTSKVVFVTYVGATPEFQASAPSGQISRSLVAGVGGLSTDGAPPVPTAEVTASRTITLTFAEAPSADPTRTGITYEVYTAADTAKATNLAATANTAAYTAAAAGPPATPATVAVSLAADIGAGAHVVEITSTAADTSADPVVEAVLIADAGGAALPTSLDVPVPEPPAPTFTASATALAEIVITFDVDVRLATATTTLSASSWLVDLDGSDGATNDAADDIDVTGVSALAGRTLTLTLDADSDNIGDTTKTPYVEYTASTSEISSVLGTPLAEGTSATATDDAPPQVVSAATGSALASRGADPADPADNVHTDHIDVTLSEAVSIEAGTDAQVAGHWAVTDDDPDGSGPEAAPAATVTAAALVLADPSDTSSRTVRLSLGGPLSGTAATPDVSYDQASAAAGRLVLAGEAASAATLVASVSGLEASDGIGPRLVAQPVRGDLTPATPAADDREALVFTFSEDLDPASVTASRAGGLLARQQVEVGSPTGYMVPQRHDDGFCSTGTLWAPATHSYPTTTVGMDTVTDLANIVTTTTTDAMGEETTTMARGTLSNTVRVSSPSYGDSVTSQRIYWFCFNMPGSSTGLEAFVSNTAVLDVAGNPYIPAEESPHSQYLNAADVRAPEFAATVIDPETVLVVYDEPARIAAGETLTAGEWRVDTTPNDTTDNTDGATYLTPASVSHSFSQMLQPEYWAYGPPGHVPMVPPGEYPEARLTIELTMATGTMLDTSAAAPAMGDDPRPMIYYAAPDSSDGAMDAMSIVEDVYGNRAAASANVRASDSIPPMVESISVAVSTTPTESAPVPSTQHARASSASPVAVTFRVTFDEAPKSGTPPVLGILTSVSPTTAAPETTSAQDTQRLWPMTETAATDDGHTWEYTWTVVNPLPGETSPRDWSAGFDLFYGIAVTDAADNSAVYTQNSRVPGGDAFPTVRLDSQGPVVRAVEMLGRPAGSDAGFTQDVGRSGGEVELLFTVDMAPSDLVTATTGAGGDITYPEGLARGAVTFFSGADEVDATAVTGSATPRADGLYEYRATATIPAGHAEGLDAIAWSITALDIYGQAGATDSSDIGTTGHPASLGFTVDNTAPMIVEASSSVGTDRSDPATERAATDPLHPWAVAGEALLVDITFDEAISAPPQVRGYGDALAVAGDGSTSRAEREFHAMTAMTAVAGSGETRWTHSWTVPDAATTPIPNSTYVVDILMPTDTAGNTMTFTGYAASDNVRIDNVAPSLRALERFVDGEDSAGTAGQWAVVSYVEHSGLRTGSATATPPDDLRAYMNNTGGATLDTQVEARVVPPGTLMLFTGADPDSALPCFDPSQDRCNPSGFALGFGYGGETASATGLEDVAGNEVSWEDAVQPAHPLAGRFGSGGVPEGYPTFDPALHAESSVPIAVMPMEGSDSSDLSALGLDASGGRLIADVEYMRPSGTSLLLDAGTRASGLPASGPADITLVGRPMDNAQRGAEYYAAILAAGAPADPGDAAALRSLAGMGAAAVVEVGRTDGPVLLSEPARVTIPGAAAAAHVYWISNTHTAAASDDAVHSIPECEASTEDTVDATEVPARAGEVTAYTDADNAECYVRDGADDALHIWTNHFTPFGASLEQLSAGVGSGCDDCTPPTLGVDSTGVRRVSGGFTYNGAAHNVEYYYTPMPLIEVETGVENVAVLKIFEDSGPDRLAHAGLAFGLGRGQHFAEAEASIGISIAHGGELSISLEDPTGAIDPETLRASSERQKCMPGGEADCVVLTIHHTFREPLEFDVVSTNVWDTRRNAWQNFYNHGIHVDGESLNPTRGIEVNGGEMTLYPLISGRVDDDGDGIYDYDERHITYMLDESYGVWRLTPDGTYAPLRNLAALHHEVDDSMYDDGRIRTHGAARSSALFAEALSQQEAIAAGIMAEMGITVEENAMPTAEPSPYEGMSVEPRLERLSEAIASEINLAERLMSGMALPPAPPAAAP